jgi:murein DD-endopeptidase MepM/ murein hydrolase activator NlpD
MCARILGFQTAAKELAEFDRLEANLENGEFELETLERVEEVLQERTDRRSLIKGIGRAGGIAALLAVAGQGIAMRRAAAWSFDPSTYTTPVTRCYPVTQWTETGSHTTGQNRYAIDIGCPSGTPVYATKSGTVVRAGWEDNIGGLVVRVNHNDLLQSVFAHLSGVNVRVGQWVNKDYSLLGWSGATGNVSGPHLHWALKDQYSNTGVNMATIPGVSYRQICS